MNLPVLVAVPEIVSALAVTVTLIALIVSIRQNTKSQRALVVDSLAAAIASINVPAMESHALGSALAKATADWGSASREERIMAHYFLFSFSNCQRTPGTNRRRESLIRHSGLDGKHCFESLSQRWRTPGMVAGPPARIFARVSKLPFPNKAAAGAW